MSETTEAKTEEQIEQLKSLLEKMIKEQPMKIGKIENGPFVRKGANHYTVQVDSSLVAVTYLKDVFNVTDTPILKRDTNVLIAGAAIIGVLPKELEKAKDPSTFKLVSWDEIGGLKSQIERIREAVETPLKNAAIMKEFGMTPLKGVLLHGSPGLGKTLIAKAIASTILKDSHADDQSFVYIKGPELLNMYVGESEANVRRIFDRCRKYTQRTGKKAVVFIDEAESLLPPRGENKGGSSFMSSTIVPMFLSEMDGFNDDSPFMILASNLPGNIDKAVLRDGRIDLKIEIRRPNKEDTEDIFKIHLKNVKTKDSIKHLALVGTEEIFACERAEKVSGAMIMTCVKKAVNIALHRYIKEKGPKGITIADMKEAVLQLEPM